MFEERGVQDCAKYQHKIRKLLDYVDEFLNVETMMNYKTWSSLPCFMFCVFDVFLSMIHLNSLIAYVSESKGTSKKIWSNAISSGRRKRETLMGMCRPFFRPTLVASWIASQRGGANIDGAVPAEAMKPVEASPKDSCTPGTFDRVVISCKIFHGFGGFNTPRIVLIHPKRQWRVSKSRSYRLVCSMCMGVQTRIYIYIYAQVWFSSGWYNYP